jgi:hypothetical protein
LLAKLPICRKKSIPVVPICHEMPVNIVKARSFWGPNQKKINFFFAVAGSPGMTHFCGLQSHHMARDSC